MRGRKTGVLRASFLLAFVAVAIALSPGTASAQYSAEPNGHEYCASQDPRGLYPANPSFYRLNVETGGSGSVAMRMYSWPVGTGDCIKYPNTPGDMSADVCPPKCGVDVQLVCELHCGTHLHSPPLPWNVVLTPTPQPGAYFLGWTGDSQCFPLTNLPRNECGLLMDRARSMNAVFGATPDQTAPTPPSPAGAAPGSYHMDITWTSSTDQYLAGYDVLLNGAVKARFPASQPPSARLQSLLCETAYTVQVVAYDFSGNESRSNPVSTQTGACNRPQAPKPNTAIHLKPAKTTRARSAFFHYGVARNSVVPATKFQCKLDRGRWVACSGRAGKRYARLKPGLHTFQVRAGDANGFDPTPAKYSWRIRR